MEIERICITGAGGFVASWVVKLLLSKGYFVHGTVRDPCDEKKNGHLMKLENADEKLKLFKANLLDYESLCTAIDGCAAVFHIASPIPDPGQAITNPEVELLEPAITGTRNVLNASLKSKVKKVVFVSSVGAVIGNPKWPKGEVMDERCWSDIEHCKATEQWYFVSKMTAELEAFEYGKRSELKVVTICPSMVIGPTLLPTANPSSLLILSFLKGTSGDQSARERMEDHHMAVVDVRDLSNAILLAYENSEAEGRYICSSYMVMTSNMVEKLKTMLPDFDYPKSFTEVGEGVTLSSQKLQNLSWKYRPLEESLMDSVKYLEEVGLLSKDTE